MKREELIEVLKRLYEDGLITGNAMTKIHLFGIKYSKFLDNCSINDLGEISEKATGKSSFKTEIRKGIKLSNFVSIIEDL